MKKILGFVSNNSFTILALVISLFAILYLKKAEIECREKGGELVKGLWAPKCIKSPAIP